MPFRKANHTFAPIGPVRLSFPQLFEAKPVTFQGQPKGDPIFNARIVIPKDHPMVPEIQRVSKELAAQSWADVAPPAQFHWALQWGPQAYPNDENLADCWIINANARAESPPQVTKAGPQGQVLTVNPETERWMVFSGCEAFVSIGFFTYQPSAQNGGIGAGLNAVFLTGRDVGRFDSRVSATTAFADVAKQYAASPAAPPPGSMPGGDPYGSTPPAAGPGSMPGGDPYGAPPPAADPGKAPWEY
jgi:hypothetical protein